MCPISDSRRLRWSTIPRTRAQAAEGARDGQRGHRVGRPRLPFFRACGRNPAMRRDRLMAVPLACAFLPGVATAGADAAVAPECAAVTDVRAPTGSQAWRAELLQRTPVRARLARDAKDRVEPGDAPALLVLDRPRAADGRCWVKVRLPSRPEQRDGLARHRADPAPADGMAHRVTPLSAPRRRPARRQGRAQVPRGRRRAGDADPRRTVLDHADLARASGRFPGQLGAVAERPQRRADALRRRRRPCRAARPRRRVAARPVGLRRQPRLRAPQQRDDRVARADDRPDPDPGHARPRSSDAHSHPSLQQNIS